MAHKKRTHLSILLLFALFLFFQTSVFANTKSYIVYLGAHGPNPNEEVVVDAHNELLGSILKDKEKAKDSIFYYYTHNINGFAATLDEETAKELSKHPSVRSVIPDKACKLHTTHSWQFLGLENSHDIPKTSLWTKAKFGEGVIIANLDTGVWPESPSFNDEGFGPIPSKWKGICQNGDDKHFKCNRKLIGARFFSSGFIQSIPTDDVISSNSPRDIMGHGSHTLSTAGGSFVSKASIFGYGEGTAKGGSPHARVATYKVCWAAHGCYLSDITQAIDMAIHDGVDVISMSIGMGGLPETYINDMMSIACFHAAAKGISVVASAGNHGPIKGMVKNHSPWVITVGASTMDREFPSYVSFNNQVIKGGSLSQNGLANKYYPMINAIDAVAPNSTERKAQICLLNALDPNKVKGKIVVCLRGFSSRTEKSGAVLQAGGVGMVLVNDHSSGNDIMDDPHVLPATHITYSDGLKLYSYLNTTKAPMGTISLPNMKYNVKPAPMMAAFSSRGPSFISKEILKPDITAPGVNVLAAFTEAVGATENDTRRVAFNTMSGTSMSCPHVAGVVGLLKTLHPSWSPAMIKSAIMTTAEVYDNSGKLLKTSPNRTANPFQCGAGHIAPNRAMNPGLVYDISTRDYLNFLCNYAYSTNLEVFTNETFSCPAKPVPGEDLNYPAITVPFLQGNMTVTRTLTNVGAPSEYTVSVEEPKGVSVTVKPKVLKFSKYGEKKTYEVTFKTIKTNAHAVFGRLVWSDGKHRVASPLLASFCKKSENPEFCDM